MPVAPDGRVDVLFYDGRADSANVMTQAHLATSTDAGTSSTNVPIWSAAFNSEVGHSLGECYGTDFCTRVGVVSDEGGAVAAGSDTRLDDQDCGRQTVFATAVDGFAPSTSPLWAPFAVGGGRRAGGMVGHETLHRLGREAATVRMAVVDKNPRRFTQP